MDIVVSLATFGTPVYVVGYLGMGYGSVNYSAYKQHTMSALF